MSKYTESFHDLISQLKDKLEVAPNSREKSLVITKIDEAQMWFRELDSKVTLPEE